MKKVLLLIHTLGGGGAEKILVNLANEIDKTKYQVTVMTVIDTGIFKKDLNSDIIYKSIIKIPKKKKINDNNPGNLLSKADKKLKFLAKIYTNLWKITPVKLFYKVFIKGGYDVEIAFLEGICAKIISGSTNPNSKKLAWIHVDLMNHPKSSVVFHNIHDEKRCYEKFDNIVCVSNTVRDKFIEKFNFDKNKVIVRYNPINREEIIEKSLIPVNDIKKLEVFTYCSIGRLIKQKGYDRLLRVHKEIIDAGYKCHLWIIGEGNKRPELEEYIIKNNLQDSVTLIGFKANPYQYLKYADLFVCSSRAEGFSTVACEATILGKPIVTVDCSGMKELLGSNNEYGLVTGNNESDLFKGLKEILDNSDLYDFYSEKIRKRSEIFDLKKSIKSIEELF